MSLVDGSQPALVALIHSVRCWLHVHVYLHTYLRTFGLADLRAVELTDFRACGVVVVPILGLAHVT